MRRCIYCPNDNFTVEHPIPRALGTFRGARLLNEHLCEWSNRDLSALDAALVRLAPDALFRELAGVKGRSSHKPVSPFYYDPLNPRAVRVLGKHPDAPYDVLWEIDPGTLKGREARQVVFRQGDRTIPIALPDQNIAGFLKQAVQERGLQGAEVLALFGCQEVGDQEFSATLEAIRSVAKAGGPIRSGRVKPGQKIQVWSELPVTREYFRAITKIAFHYVLAYVPGRVFTGHETAFDAAKRFIAAGED